MSTNERRPIRSFCFLVNCTYDAPPGGVRIAGAAESRRDPHSSHSTARVTVPHVPRNSLPTCLMVLSATVLPASWLLGSVSLYVSIDPMLTAEAEISSNSEAAT